MKKQLFNFVFLTGISVFSFSQTLQAQESSTPLGHEATAAVKAEVTHRLLWGSKVSPYVRKVIVTLEEKKIPYELKEILPTKLLQATHQQVPKDFSKVSPFGKIPAYVETGPSGTFSLSDSDVIENYIEQTVSENPLRPKEARTNAEVSWMIKYADDVMAPLTHGVLFEKVVKVKVLNQKSDENKINDIFKTKLPDVFSFLESKLSDDREWIAGTPHFSLADVAVVAHLSSLLTSGYTVDILMTSKYPKLKAYVQKVLDRDSFKKALI